MGLIGVKFVVDTQWWRGGYRLKNSIFFQNIFKFTCNTGPSARLNNNTRHYYIYMFRKAGQTAGPIGLKFLWTRMGGRGV